MDFSACEKELNGRLGWFAAPGLPPSVAKYNRVVERSPVTSRKPHPSLPVEEARAADRN